MKRLLTSSDAARILGVAAATVRQMAKRGVLRIAAVTDGGNRLFASEDVEALLARRRDAARQANARSRR
jgi:excisionase family DNA binding protein